MKNTDGDSQNIDIRIEKRKKKNNINRIIRKVVLTIIILVVVFFLLKYAGAFNVKNVNITGNENTEVEDIIAAGQIEKGASYFSFAGKKARESIEKLPYVKTAKITFLPFAPVKISIVERKPLFQGVYNGKFYLIDEELRVLDEKNMYNPELFTLENVEFENYPVGSFLFGTEDRQKAEFLFEIFKNERLKPLIGIVSLKDDMAEITTKEGIKLVFGPYENTVYKLKVLSKVMDDVASKGIVADTIYLNKGPNPILETKN